MTGQPVTGIILAGGESRRMGTFKPLVEYKGKPLIRWIYDALAPICSEIIIIANSGDFPDMIASIYPDNYPGNGPAAGIEAGLSHCRTNLALFCSCDTPNLPTALFEHLLAKHDGFDISIAGHDDTNEPLIGVYSKTVHGAYKEALLAGDPHPPRIMKKCKWQEIPFGPGQNFWHPDLFLNLNSPSDLK
jgi:molybdopterin-guanine dinucleotide biosynthesis protein A